MRPLPRFVPANDVILTARRRDRGCPGLIAIALLVAAGGCRREVVTPAPDLAGGDVGVRDAAVDDAAGDAARDSGGGQDAPRDTGMGVELGTVDLRAAVDLATAMDLAAALDFSPVDLVPVPPCDGGGLIVCADQCVDPLFDRRNCGVCGQTCPVGNICARGACAPLCTSWGLSCKGVCVDYQTDGNNCGACGYQCPAGTACWNGICGACPVDRTACSRSCVELSTDTRNCGACGTLCASTQRCVAGRCQ